MFDKYKIVVDSGKTKEKIFLLFSLKEGFIILGTMIVIYFLLEKLIGGILPFVIGVGFAIIVGFMFVEMPNHLNIWQHVQLLLHYFMKTPKAYYYYIRKTKVKEVNEYHGKKQKRKKKTKNQNNQEQQKGFAH